MWFPKLETIYYLPKFRKKTMFAVAVLKLLRNTGDTSIILHALLFRALIELYYLFG